MASQGEMDAQSELSVNASTAGTEYARTVATRTVSEIYPDDSASRRVRATGGLTSGATQSEVSQPSVASLRSSDEENLYTVIDGRSFTSASDIYVLPADDEEHSRLDMQHYATCLTLNGLFPFQALVKHLLREGQGFRPQILDVGTGSGRWALDMANAFPWADVVGIDLVPPAFLTRDEIPDNCRFEVDNANLSMQHYADTFDFVHARSVETGLNDGESFLYEMARILKPGGLLVTGTGDAQFWDPNFKPIPWVKPGEPGFSRSQFILGMAYKALWNRGCVGMNSTLWWKEWLETSPNFGKVYKQDIYIPLGPWKEGADERETMAGRLFREDIVRAFTNWRRLLSEDGHQDEEITQWIEECTAELKDLTVHQYFRYKFIAAVRSDQEFEERGMPIQVDLTSRTFVQGIDSTERK